MRFSRQPVHAQQYNQYASVQTMARHWLWSEWSSIGQGVVLDLGAGPVACPASAHANSTVLAVDQSLAMLSQSKGYAGCVTAEARALPFARGAVQGIASSMAMQWVGTEGLAEWSRVLDHSGQMAFVVPIAGTLAGFRDCLESAGITPRILAFHDERTWVSAARGVGFRLTSVEIRHCREPYVDRRQLVRALTRIGASGDMHWPSRASRRATLVALDHWCASGRACLDYVLLRVQGEKPFVTS